MTTLTGGLARQGIVVSSDLNPRFTLQIVAGDLVEVSSPVLDSAVITDVPSTNTLFDPEDSSFHPDDE